MKEILQNHKIIAIDCDDVISNTITYFLEFYDLKNTDGDKIRFEDIKNYNFSQNPGFGKTNEEFVQMFIELFERDTDNYNILPIKGAFEVLKKLKNSGKKLYVITARQSFFEQYTKKWIDKYFPNIFEDIYFCNHEGGGTYLEKADICKQIGATILLDDSFSNAETCLEEKIDVILFNKPWNKDKKVDNIKKGVNFVRVKNWKEIKD